MHARIKPLASIWMIACMLLAALCANTAWAQTGGGKTNIAAELVAEGPATPGRIVDLALHFRPAPGWHGYWINPGDAGYGMSLKWRFPPGWRAGGPLYPVPQTLVIGGLMNHVYEGDYAVIVPVSVPAGLAEGTVPVEVEAEWLACTDKICVPERAVLSLRIQVVGQGARDKRFDRWRAALPPLLDSPANFELKDKLLRIAVPLPASLQVNDPHIFIQNDELVDYVAPQRFFREGDTLVGEIARRGSAAPREIRGILRLGARDGISFAATAGKVPAGLAPLNGEGKGAGPLWLLALGALAGGLLLNIMPCVFPILSLKAISLARAGESEAQARREGITYTAGAILACLALGALLLALRAAGEQVGWAFQLQEPGVVIALLALAVAIAANLAGVFELPTLPITRAGHPSGAFATGLLAAFVATPCTGPFMAAAMGAALLLPEPQALLLFGCLGLGLALPFLLLGFLPPLRRMLPRPGAWMERFRHWMALPMVLTALALLWLTYRLGGGGFALVAAVAMGGLVLALWAFGQRQRQGKPGLRSFVLIMAPFALFAALALPPSFDPAKREEAGLIDAKPYSASVLAQARASTRPIFLWFTADWCLTCKVNERVAIERETTRDLFRRAGVIAIRGDWTRRDPEITRYLDSKGAAGVPLYVWIDANGAETVLPQILTPDSLATLARKAAATDSPGGTMPQAGRAGR
jgi:DsbC/DsbD-like thiol-disulfide interchange protein/cytochrome c biogenesis protein CcdA